MYLELGDDGPLTLSHEVLVHLGVRPGDRVSVELHPGGRVRLRASPRRPVSSIFGLLQRDGEPPLTIEEIREITQDGWAGDR